MMGEKKRVSFGYILPHKEFEDDELKHKFNASLLSIVDETKKPVKPPNEQ